VGNYASKSGQGKTLTERWDGSRFKVVSSPGVPNTPNILRGVSALSASDAWAVGDTGTIQGTQTLTEHWNGTRWKIFPSPNLGLYNYLNAVAAISANDAWAVGRWDTEQEVVSTLIEHWDGSSWQVVSSPNVTSFNELYAVTVVSAKDIWAVGYYVTFRQDGAAINQTLTEHWDGTTWQVVSSPNVENISNTLNGVTVVSSSNVWAVGGLYDPGTGQGSTLIAHWNGSQWKIVTSPNPGSYNILWAVAADTTGRAVAVGVYTVNFGPGRTLAEIHDV
jgi:hypothetical protein